MFVAKLLRHRNFFSHIYTCTLTRIFDLDLCFIHHKSKQTQTRRRRTTLINWFNNKTCVSIMFSIFQIVTSNEWDFWWKPECNEGYLDFLHSLKPPLLSYRQFHVTATFVFGFLTLSTCIGSPVCIAWIWHEWMRVEYILHIYPCIYAYLLIAKSGMESRMFACQPARQPSSLYVSSSAFMCRFVWVRVRMPLWVCVWNSSMKIQCIYSYTRTWKYIV